MENTSPSTKNYEILKTSLLEALSGTDVQIYGEKYDKALGLITQEKRDSFMMDLLRARYLTEQGSEIDSKYIPEYPQHVYRENSGMARELGFMKQNPDHIENIKKFINGLEDYAKIYADISQNQRVFIRHMTESNEINEVYQPILAACATNHEDAEYIAEQYDRLWVLLTLNQLYSENDLRQITHRINRTLRKGNHKSKEDYKKLFDDELQNALKKVGKTSTLDYETFKSITYDDTALSFFRYLLARVEKYLREKAKIPSDGKQSVDQLCKKNTHQVERAIYLNETNIQIFGSKEEVEKMSKYAREPYTHAVQSRYRHRCNLREQTPSLLSVKLDLGTNALQGILYSI